MMNADVLAALVRLRKSLAQPFTGAKLIDVQNGRGRIATAYKAADQLDRALGVEPVRGATITRVHSCS